VVAASWAVSMASRLRVVNFSAPKVLICGSVSSDSCGATQCGRHLVQRARS
jgi:hypothetical protein